MEQITIGRIRTSHGVKGYLKVQSFSGTTEHFFALKNVVLKNGIREKAFHIEDVKKNGSSVLFKLGGIDTPEAGRVYSGWEIWVDKKYAVPLEPGEFYIRDMIGCSLIFNSKEIGKVRGVLDTMASELLEVETVNGLVIIPFVNEFIGMVDVSAQTIELKDNRLLT